MAPVTSPAKEAVASAATASGVTVVGQNEAFAKVAAPAGAASAPVTPTVANAVVAPPQTAAVASATASVPPATVPTQKTPGGSSVTGGAPTADSTKLATDSVKALWRDGTYSGWGTSRHGDIEATVVIEGGKITGASISRCLTRYSCSWIAHLQQQVVTRQSPEVDYVSGATQSANAFYYAVVDALQKAK